MQVPAAATPTARERSCTETEPRRGPLRAVVVVGRDWLGLFVAMLCEDVLPDDVEIILVGAPVEAATSLTRALLAAARPPRVQVRDEVLLPGADHGLWELVRDRDVRLVLCATELPGEQLVAQNLAMRTSACLYGATCAGVGWAGPAVPGCFGPGAQRPGVAIRLAQTLAAVATDVCTTTGPLGGPGPTASTPDPASGS